MAPGHVVVEHLMEGADDYHDRPKDDWLKRAIDESAIDNIIYRHLVGEMGEQTNIFGSQKLAKVDVIFDGRGTRVVVNGDEVETTRGLGAVRIDEDIIRDVYAPDNVCERVARDLFRELARCGPVVAINRVNVDMADGAVTFEAEAMIQRPTAIQRLRAAIDDGGRR